MKVTVIMEKATDGYYSCYVEDELDGFGLMGHGATAEEAKKDMLLAYDEIKEMFSQEGKDISELEFVYKYDMQTFFNYFSFLNISKIGAMAGEKQYNKIKDCINRIAHELSAATF